MVDTNDLVLVNSLVQLVVMNVNDYSGTPFNTCEILRNLVCALAAEGDNAVKFTALLSGATRPIHPTWNISSYACDITCQGIGVQLGVNLESGQCIDRQYIVARVD